MKAWLLYHTWSMVLAVLPLWHTQPIGSWRNRVWYYAASSAYWWGEVLDGRVDYD